MDPGFSKGGGGLMVHDHGKEEGVGGGCAPSHTKRWKLLPLMFVDFDARNLWHFG